MNKEAEKKRLASIVFEGAGDDVTHSAMDLDGSWCNYKKEPRSTIVGSMAGWIHTEVQTADYTPWEPCKNQPETELPWQETLLRREDYD